MCVTNTAVLPVESIVEFVKLAEAIAPISVLYDRYTSGTLSFNELGALADILDGLNVLEGYPKAVNLKDALTQALESMSEKTS